MTLLGCNVRTAHGWGCETRTGDLLVARGIVVEGVPGHTLSPLRAVRGPVRLAEPDRVLRGRMGLSPRALTLREGLDGVRWLTEQPYQPGWCWGLKQQ